jgi:hypothetical protein
MSEDPPPIPGIHADPGGIGFAESAVRDRSIMPAMLHHDSGNIYRLDISGLLSREEFAFAEDELAIAIARIGSARLLCVLKEFQGWNTAGDWHNMDFYMKHGDTIERIAVVGEERWRDLTLMFASADLRQAPVKFFPASSLVTAREWLSV